MLSPTTRCIRTVPYWLMGIMSYSTVPELHPSKVKIIVPSEPAGSEVNDHTDSNKLINTPQLLHRGQTRDVELPTAEPGSVAVEGNNTLVAI